MTRSRAPARNLVPPRVFVATIDDRVVATFMAVQRSQALQLCREQWFLDDLKSHRDDAGQPIWDGVAKVTVRNAEPHEITAHSAAMNEAIEKGSCDSDEMFVSFPTTIVKTHA